MTVSPFSVPPGPERRELERQQGLNISPEDYTTEEWAALGREAAAHAKVFADMQANPSS